MKVWALRKCYGYLKDEKSTHEVYWVRFGKFCLLEYYPNPKHHFSGNPFACWWNARRFTMVWFGAYSKWGTADCT